MDAICDIQVPTSYLLAFLEDLELGPAKRRELQAMAGLPAGGLADQHSRLRLDRLLATLRTIDAMTAPGWHIEPTVRLEAAHHGPLGIAVVTAATVRQALQTLIRFEPTRAPWTLLQTCTDHDRLALRVVPVIELQPPADVLMEMNLIALACLIGPLLGPHARELSVNFPPAYRPWEAQLRQRLPGSITVSEPGYLISLPRALLDRPCLMADTELHTNAVARCEALMLNQDRHGPLAARIRQRLVALEGRSPGLEGMAIELGLSARSLIRRLAADGTSYREQVDQVRRTLARDLLLHSELSIAEIADRLGYADPANFGRAFRRWFGHSPGGLRTRRPPG